MNEMPVQRLAVLLACHNRRDITLECLRRLFENQAKLQIDMEVYLVDDGSTDGTGDAVRMDYPSIHVIDGDGELYWSGGMRAAFAAAMHQGYDYYLWLNDDTHLYPGALDILFTAMQDVKTQGHLKSVICGSTWDPYKKELSYGGYKRRKERFRTVLAKLYPTDKPLRCDTMNGNCVLIAESVTRCVGNIDLAFTHSMGDLDYGFRASDAGCSIWVAPGFVADCERNTEKELCNDKSQPLNVSWKKLVRATGLPPKEWLVYTRRHTGWFWPLYWGSPYLKFWINVLANKLREIIHFRWKSG